MKEDRLEAKGKVCASDTGKKRRKGRVRCTAELFFFIGHMFPLLLHTLVCACACVQCNAELLMM